MNEEILPSINSPQDLKTLKKDELPKLASEIRIKLIDVISKTGGHLASNLGSIEFTLALHYVFNSPCDKFVWDVGHQSYTHKMLTGRSNLFATLRKTDGLSGFTHPEESIHDHFHVGHAGTALSQAIGLAEARDLLGEDYYIVAIIGDATLTCGMSLEALNNISRKYKKFIVILNDNEMSISKTVGAITRILSRMLSNPTTNWLYQEIDYFVKRVPGCGTFLSEKGHRIKEAAKHLFSPAAFFEHFGLSYIGPVNGHDPFLLIQTLQGVRDSEWPVIIHILTEKGHGMKEAENNPVLWHGAKPFCVNTGKFHASPIPSPTFPKIFGNLLLQMGQEDESIVAVTPAMSAGSCLDGFAEKFPKRFFDVGIAEGHSVTFSGALACQRKLKVFCSIYSTFLQRAMDNVFHDVCLQDIPLVFAVDRAGLAGGDGATHNGIYDISFLSSMPNIVICQPRCGDLLKDLMHSAHSWKKPAAIRYPNLPTTVSDRAPEAISLGKAEILRQGKEILLLAVGHSINTALEVAELLEQKWELRPTVVDPIFIKPLDEELFTKLFKSHSLVVTIDEHSSPAGFGSLINNFIVTNSLPIHCINCALPEEFIQHGSHADLLKKCALDADSILEKLEKAYDFSCPAIHY